MGTNQYRSGCRSAATNPNTSYAYSYTCGDAVHPGDSNANAHSNSDGNSNGYGDSNGNGHSYAECNSDSDGNGHGYHYSVSDTYGDTKSHPETSSYSTSPPDTIGKGL